MSELLQARKKRATAALNALPESIRVGAYDIAILLRDRHLTTRDLLGQYDQDAEVISLSTGFENSTKVVETFIHEVNHAVYRQGGLENGDDEERIVLVMSHGQAQIFRDNPWLCQWINKYSD